MVTDFSSLYQKYALDVFRFALYLSGDRSEAEDITSETFVRAWTSPEAIRAETVRGYFFTIARSLFLQGLRKKRRHVELSDELRDPQAGPPVHAEQKAEIRAVMDGLQQLPESDRAALLNARAGRECADEEIGTGAGDFARGGENENPPGAADVDGNSRNLGGYDDGDARSDSGFCCRFIFPGKRVWTPRRWWKAS